MSRPELGKVVNVEDILYPKAIQEMVEGLLHGGDLMGAGGDLTRWYNVDPAHTQVRKLAERILWGELKYRPTTDSDNEWYHLSIDAWRVTDDCEEGSTNHTIPVQEDAEPRDHQLLRSLAWVEVPLVGQVMISTTPETHEEEGSIVVSPGELFLAAANVRELAVNVPVGATNMELTFDQHYKRNF